VGFDVGRIIRAKSSVSSKHRVSYKTSSASGETSISPSEHSAGSLRRRSAFAVRE
jgi:hypothetical protein